MVGQSMFTKPFTKLKKVGEDRSITAQYKQALDVLSIQRHSNTRMAVVVHLYYSESWPSIVSRLQHISGQQFDLFVTLPTSGQAFITVIKADYPHAYITIVPNRGRDVLPFLIVAQAVQQAGYTFLLKLHSKKSTHRTDGKEWLCSMLDNLLPANRTVIAELVETLEKSDTGIIGPTDQYLPLTVNFEANGTHMTNILTSIYGTAKTYDVLQTHRPDYGFFAGTMFWARLDSLASLLDQVFGVKCFETEVGQIDATFAHAMERVFCLVSQIENRVLYEISSTGVRPIDYGSGTAPDWSKVYIEPEA